MDEQTTKRLVLIRHGPTAWNSEGRIQGRTDIALSPDGRATVKLWQLPNELAALPVWSSPLQRTRETAQILCGAEPLVAPEFIEMDWGRFEGRQLVELRDTLGEALAQNEARGFDFRPDAGESPRDVLQRVTTWTQTMSSSAAVIVTHKGVIRAVVANALQWDLKGKPPVKLQWQHAHIVDVFVDGSMQVVSLNIPLT